MLSSRLNAFVMTTIQMTVINDVVCLAAGDVYANSRTDREECGDQLHDDSRRGAERVLVPLVGDVIGHELDLQR